MNSLQVINRNKEKSLNQSNTISRTITKISSATSYKLIKYGIHLLDLKFRYNETKLTLDEYRKIDLLNSKNWKNIEWEDFECNFLINDFNKELDIKKSGNQREIIKDILDKATNEKIILEYQNKLEIFSWFVKANYNFDSENKVTSVSLVFNPGVLGVALVRNGDYYSHLELLVVGRIKSFYGLRIYELIKSFYNKKGKYGNDFGEWKTDWYSIKQIREFLQCENNYKGRVNNFIAKVINSPVKEINEVCRELKVNIKITPEIQRGGRNGNQIKAIRFICNEYMQPYELDEGYREAIEERLEMEKMFEEEELKMKQLKEKYKDQWENFRQEILEGNKNNPILQNEEIRNGEIMDAMIAEYIKNCLEE